MEPAPSADEELRTSTASGHQLALVDVVGGRHAQYAETLVELHEQHFPDYHFSRDRVRADACRPSLRGHVVVHQWLVLVDGEPAGFLLFDTNLARHIGVSHYVALNPLASRLVVEGLRCLDWLYRALVAQVQRDLGDQPAFGCVGEAADDRVRLFEWIGMHRLEVEYREPVTDHRWHGAETPTAAINLLWRPPLGADVDSMKPAAAQAGSAAFLLDHYGFDPEIPWVATAVGVQRALPGPLDR